MSQGGKTVIFKLILEDFSSFKLSRIFFSFYFFDDNSIPQIQGGVQLYKKFLKLISGLLKYNQFKLYLFG